MNHETSSHPPHSPQPEKKDQKAKRCKIESTRSRDRGNTNMNKKGENSQKETARSKFPRVWAKKEETPGKGANLQKKMNWETPRGTTLGAGLVIKTQEIGWNRHTIKRGGGRKEIILSNVWYLLQNKRTTESEGLKKHRETTLQVIQNIHALTFLAERGGGVSSPDIHNWIFRHTKRVSRLQT